MGAQTLQTNGKEKKKSVATVNSDPYFICIDSTKITENDRAQYDIPASKRSPNQFSQIIIFGYSYQHLCY